MFILIMLFQKKALTFSKNKTLSMESSTPENDSVTAMVQAIDTVAVCEGETVSGVFIDGEKDML